MIIYWLMALPTAIIAYYCGTVSTLVLAGRFVFHKNLRKLGRGDVFLSNFRRIYGIKGALLLLLTEAIKDIVPILIGGLIFMIKGHADVGRAFAGFCLVMGRLWPFTNMKGSHASLAMVFAAIMSAPSVGIAGGVVIAALTLWTKYVSLGTFAGALAIIMFAVLVIDEKIILYLVVFTAAAVLIKHIPAIVRITKGREKKFSFETDLTYKLDNRF